MKSSSFFVLFFILIIGTIPFQMQAIHPSNQELKENLAHSDSLKKSKKNVFLKKWKTNFINKKIQKTIAKNPEIVKLSRISLGLGIATPGLLIALVTGLFVVYFPFILLFSVGLAGAIVSIITLSKIKKEGNPDKYKTEKSRATWGLFFSLLPLTLLAAIFIILSQIRF